MFSPFRRSSCTSVRQKQPVSPNYLSHRAQSGNLALSRLRFTEPHDLTLFLCVREEEGKSSPPGLTQTLYRFSNDIYSAVTVAPQRSLRHTEDQIVEFTSIICRIKLYFPEKNPCDLKHKAASGSSQWKTAGVSKNDLRLLASWLEKSPIKQATNHA